MEDKLKIMMTADTVGGVWTYAMALCEALQPYNVEVHLMTMGKWLNDAQNRQVRQLDNVILYESNLKLEWMDDPWDDIKLAEEWIGSVYKKVMPDIIHFNNYAEVRSEWECSIITVFHSCVQTWFKAVKSEEAPEMWDRYRAIVERALFLSDAVVFPTAAMKEQAMQVYGSIPCTKVIYNGGNPASSSSITKEPFILSAGRVWDEAKNISLLSEIASQLPWPVAIAGDSASPDGKVYQPDNVQFLGHLQAGHLQEQMERAAIFAMPAKYEPFGLAVLEAASAGCALALSDISTLREIWGDAALYFDPNDKEDAARVIRQLTDNEALRQSMAAKAQARAGRYTAEAMAANYMELYQKLLEENRVELTAK